MRWKFWQAEEKAQPFVSDEVAAPRPDAVPESAPEPVHEPPALHIEPEPAAREPEPEPEVPAQVTLTIDEAKGVIKEAGGDVIQVGFLASAYRRSLEEDPASPETARLGRNPRAPRLRATTRARGSRAGRPTSIRGCRPRS